jgi:hypothetical protein
MNLVPPSSCFFLNQWPKERPFSCTVSKMWSATANSFFKNYSSNYGINLQKIIFNSPTTILPMFLAREFSHKIEAVFAGFEGILWVWIMGSWNVMSLGYGSNVSVSVIVVVILILNSKSWYGGWQYAKAPVARRPGQLFLTYLYIRILKPKSQRQYMRGLIYEVTLPTKFRQKSDKWLYLLKDTVFWKVESLVFRASLHGPKLQLQTSKSLSVLSLKI